MHRVMEYTVVRIVFTRSYGRGEGKVEEQPPHKPANSQLMREPEEQCRGCYPCNMHLCSTNVITAVVRLTSIYYSSTKAE